MSDKDKDQEAVAEGESPADTAEQAETAEAAEAVEAVAAPEAEEPAEPAAAAAAAETATGPGIAMTTWLALVVAVFALAAAGFATWTAWRTASDTTAADNFASLDSRLATTARRLDELNATLAGLEQRDIATPADVDALRRELDEQLGLLGGVPARLATLESSVASLAGISEGARDAWVLAEAEYYMQIANAQLQLAGNPHLASLALKMADERIVQLANPGLTDVRRTLADELAALEVMAKPDIEGATLMLASLARVVESLPLASRDTESDEQDGDVDSEQSGASRAWASVKNAVSGLVRVTPPERARLVQLSPDAEYFLRSNLALQLQSARLALLRGEQAAFEQTLDDIDALLNDYFDTGSAQVASAQETIAEIRGSVFTADTPDISGSLQLLRRYRTLQETAQ